MKLVPRGPINNKPSIVQIMAGRQSGDKLLSEPMMVNLLSQICVTWPKWVKQNPTSTRIPHNKSHCSVLWDFIAPVHCLIIAGPIADIPTKLNLHYWQFLGTTFCWHAQTELFRWNPCLGAWLKETLQSSTKPSKYEYLFRFYIIDAVLKSISKGNKILPAFAQYPAWQWHAM